MTFNVREGQRVAEAVAALARHPDLRDADIADRGRAKDPVATPRPHQAARTHRDQRLVRHASGPVRVYSTHLGSPWDTGEGSRRDQAASILDDAEGSPDPVVVAGDFNSERVGRLFEKRGYCWPTRDVGPTIHRFSVDRVFARGLCATATGPRAGVARDVKDASDHRPVWAILG